MKRAIPYTSLWFSVSVWAFITLCVLAGLAYVLNQNYLFDHRAKPVQGMIDRKFVQTSHGGRGGTTHKYYLVYHYQVGNVIFNCQSDVWYQTYWSVLVGGPVPLLYVTDQPGDHRIAMPEEARKLRLLTNVLITITLLLLIGGIFSISYYVRRNRLYRWLHESGIQCMGTVSTVDFDRRGRARTIYFFLNFDFSDNLGRNIPARSWYLKPGEQARWAAGRQLPVYFDPNNSSRFTIDLDPRRS